MADNTDTYVSVVQLTNDIVCQERLRELRKFYFEQFGAEPKFYVNVPGRVNIIGEHVDYCGYPVLPMAIEQSILLAVGHSSQGQLHLRNISEQFENYKCDLETFRIEIPESGSPKWYNYFLCGVKGIFENMLGEFPKIGMFVAVSGNIPHSSGLSSSSALVSSATLATAYAYNFPLERKILASVSAKCERYIGTQGGGMDQAIAFFAKKGCAQFIQFHPELRANSIKLPSNVCFVVANSLAAINKAATSDFNERVVECRIACRILAKHLKYNSWRKITHFAELQAVMNYSLTQLNQLIQNVLHQDSYTKNDILNILQISEQDFKDCFLTSNTRHMTIFKIRQRALHVIQESIRVEHFKDICEKTGSPLQVLSQLMSQSHQSLNTLYECSHPLLNELVRISDEIGIGARLTGAGWGGCIVALCDSMQQCHAYIRELKDKYYNNISIEQNFDIENVVFATYPQNGAIVILPQI